MFFLSQTKVRNCARVFFPVNGIHVTGFCVSGRKNHQPAEPTHDEMSAAVKDFVTVVSVDGCAGSRQPVPEDSFVTVLSIGQDDDGGDRATGADAAAVTPAEEVLVYRLPGERLGFGLRFDGVDTCNRLFVQSCAEGSPASRTQASWGSLSPGDEIVEINGRPVNRLSRDDCVRCLKESGLVVKLHMIDGRLAAKAPPPVPPRKQKKPEPLPIVSSVYTDAVERRVSILPVRDNHDHKNSFFFAEILVNRVRPMPFTR